MKRQRFLQHLQRHGCRIVDEGGRHTRLSNPATDRRSVLPRHREIKPNLVRIICHQLGVPVPTER